MKYVNVPMELPIVVIIKNDYCLSSGRYIRFIPPQKNDKYFITLNKLIVLQEKQVKTKKSDDYHYAEIGDIDVNNGEITFHRMKGYQLPDKRPLIANVGDILISTVRTYRKGIGYVSTDIDNLVTTNAVINICGVTDFVPNLTLLYVYSFLRSDFFTEQVWSMLNRGVYPQCR